MVVLRGVRAMISLTMTYFHRRASTIIGAKAFHLPVRDGKGVGPPCYGRQAKLALVRFTNLGKSTNKALAVSRAYASQHIFHATAYNLIGYRVKPHGQLVLVSCVHYCTSTPSLSTSWSRTTLQGGSSPRDTSSSDKLPA